MGRKSDNRCHEAIRYTSGEQLVLADADALKRLLSMQAPQRSAFISKHDCGRALLLAGSAAYRGAALLALGACLRSGVGYVTLNSDDRVSELAARLYPSALYGERCFSATLSHAHFSEHIMLLKQFMARLTEFAARPANIGIGQRAAVVAAGAACGIATASTATAAGLLKCTPIAEIISLLAEITAPFVAAGSLRHTESVKLSHFVKQLLIADAVLIGSGRALSLASTAELLWAILLAERLVIDADALTLLAALHRYAPTLLHTVLDLRMYLGARPPLLTPHYGELQHLSCFLEREAVPSASALRSRLSSTEPADVTEGGQSQSLFGSRQSLSALDEERIALARALELATPFKIVIKGAPTYYFTSAVGNSLASAVGNERITAATRERINLSDSACETSAAGSSSDCVTAQLVGSSAALPSQPFAVSSAITGEHAAGRLYLWRNGSGNNALAKAGSGDVLAGLLCGFAADRTIDEDTAVLLSVYLHGRIADIASASIGKRALLPSDLIEYLPQALHEVHWRD